MGRIKHYFDFLWAMTEREIKARYKKTIFGFLWMILNPLVQMIIIGVIFSFFIKIPVDNYFLYLFAGLLPWQFFSVSLNSATDSYVTNRYLLQKSKFSLEVIPLSIVLANFFHFAIALIIFISFLILSDSIKFPNIFLLIPASVMLLIFTIGASLLTSSLQVKFRDIKYFVQAALILWFYATPIIYTLDLIPSKSIPLFALNPLTFLFELFHLSLNFQSHFSVVYVLANLTISLVTLVLGISIFRKESKYFVDLL